MPPLFNNMNILNTILNTRTTLRISGNLPTVCYDEQTANILPNGINYCLSWRSRTNYRWYINVITQPIVKNSTDEIDPRWYFSSGLSKYPNYLQHKKFILSITPDGYIIIFGVVQVIFTSVSPNLAMLDTNKKFKFSTIY
ncbi:hypothetical protein Glove_91g81 [Diversispora epigaea]|uniref:Uncharacterized protein n=1 Tax=Diversispora epigaea TaxID=1348612 RepID=A0A397JCA4_9GLOM|nr:hypothetical protein Glove_91g81 [Diversispora epigaea]